MSSGDLGESEESSGEEGGGDEEAEEEEEEEEAVDDEDEDEEDDPMRDRRRIGIDSVFRLLRSDEPMTDLRGRGFTQVLVDRAIDAYFNVWDAAMRGGEVRGEAAEVFYGARMRAEREAAEQESGRETDESETEMGGSDDEGEGGRKRGRGSDEEGDGRDPGVLDLSRGAAKSKRGKGPTDAFAPGGSGEGVAERVGRLVGCVLDPDAPQPPLSVNDAIMEHTELVARFSKLCRNVEDFDHTTDQPNGETMLSKNNELGLARGQRLARIGVMIAGAKNMLLGASLSLSCLNEEAYAALSWEETLLVHLADDNARPHQIVYFHLLEVLNSPVNGGPFRRMGETVFKEIVTEEGYRTHAWTEHDEITDFIHSEINPTHCYAMWSVMTSSDFNMPGRLKDQLVEANDVRFPMLKWNRYLFAFENGIFNSIQLAFYPFSKRKRWAAIARRAERRIRTAWDEMTERMKKAYTNLSPFAPPSRDDAASRFFSMHFDERHLFPETPLMEINARDIPCRDLLCIFKSQKFTDDTIRDKLWSMGKMMFPVGLLEDTQVFSFDMGKGGTGKSTALNALKSFFHTRRVCVLQSDCEEVFGLEPTLTGGARKCVLGGYTKVPDTVDALMAPEVKEDFRLSSAKVQQFTSGDAVSVARKGKTAVLVPKWVAPIALAGNVIPRKSNWRDLSGAVLRRCNLYAYNIKIAESQIDSDLPMRIEESTPEVLPCIVIMFIQGSVRIGKRSVWTPGVFGEQTIKFRDVVAVSTQPLRNFLLNSGRVKLAGPGPDGKPQRTRYMPEEKFRTLLAEWTRSIGIAQVPYTSENYESVFEDLAIERRLSMQQVDNAIYTGQFLFGVEEYDESAAMEDIDQEEEAEGEDERGDVEDEMDEEEIEEEEEAEAEEEAEEAAEVEEMEEGHAPQRTKRGRDGDGDADAGSGGGERRRRRG